jgi:hypothetical protein
MVFFVGSLPKSFRTGIGGCEGFYGNDCVGGSRKFFTEIITIKSGSLKLLVLINPKSLIFLLEDFQASRRCQPKAGTYLEIATKKLVTLERRSPNYQRAFLPKRITKVRILAYFSNFQRSPEFLGNPFPNLPITENR